MMQTYLCRSTCLSCGRSTTERGAIHTLTGSRRRFRTLCSAVNGEQWYANLAVSGRCRHCGRHHIWSPRLRNGLALAMALLTLIALALLCGLPGTMAQALAYAALGCCMSKVSSCAMLLVTRWRIRKVRNVAALPWIEACR